MNHISLTSMPDAKLVESWNGSLAQMSFATHYTTPNYFTDPYMGGDRFAVLAFDSADRIDAVMTGVVGGQKIVSGLFTRPQMVFREGADRAEAFAALMEGVDELSPAAELVDVFSWTALSGLDLGEMTEQTSKDTNSIVILDLSGGSEAVFAKFSQTRRNEIRKAIKQARVEVKTLETETELTELFNISRDWNARKGLAADTLDRMKLAAGQTENRRVIIAKIDGAVVAGSFYRFCPGAVVEYAANYSTPEFQKFRPNDLIGWQAIQWACESGFSHFSMGGSHLFLRRFGGVIMQTYRYRRDRSFFKTHELRERARAIGVGAFKSLPEGIKANVRRIFSK